MTLPNSGGTEWAATQASPWTAVNDALRRLDALFSRAIIQDRDLATPPGSCADGAGYLVAASPTGAWTGKAGQLAIAQGTNAASGWLFVVVQRTRFQLGIVDEAVEVMWNGSAWV